MAPVPAQEFVSNSVDYLRVVGGGLAGLVLAARSCPGTHFADAIIFIFISTILSVSVYNVDKYVNKATGSAKAPEAKFHGTILTAPKPFKATVVPRVLPRPERFWATFVNEHEAPASNMHTFVVIYNVVFNCIRLTASSLTYHSRPFFRLGLPRAEAPMQIFR
ncbi:hypothetical protein OF83DRAFT_1169983 [Amylostereum chailletii]|nr:hypothetical protein OF83DRAFT_1169983 [Amylostereum chailletii]